LFNCWLCRWLGRGARCRQAARIAAPVSHKALQARTREARACHFALRARRIAAVRAIVAWVLRRQVSWLCSRCSGRRRHRWRCCFLFSRLWCRYYRCHAARRAAAIAHKALQASTRDARASHHTLSAVGIAAMRAVVAWVFGRHVRRLCRRRCCWLCCRRCRGHSGRYRGCSGGSGRGWCRG
jgi:hypothetical protein